MSAAIKYITDKNKHIRLIPTSYIAIATNEIYNWLLYS